MQRDTSAWVVFNKELIECNPATAHSHHHRAAEDSHQTQLLRFTKLPANK